MNLLNNTHSTISLPSFEMNNTSQLLNKRVTEKDSLYYICLIVKKRLEQLPLLKPYLNLAYSTAELLCERQALLLAQRKQQLHQSYDSLTLISSSNSSFLQSPGNRISSVSSISMDSMDSEKISTTSSNEGAFVMRSSSHSSSSNLSSNKNDLLTFSIGILPITTDCDPVTQLSNLFQQGSPLCIIFNAVKPQHKLTVVSSDDIKVCKKSIYDFICACKMYLTLTDEELFTISDIFSNSTEKLIKILDVIKTLLDSAPSIFPSSSAITYTASIANSNTDHGKIVREFLETERKYVYDLEILYNFSKQLVDYNIINTEELYMLFPNLHEVIEFQRRFLISLEVNAQVENEMQRIGSIFVHSQNFFKLYEPWSIGQTAAIDYIASLPSFNANASHLIIKNKLELQSFLLKPVQRLCKYPLLLKQLLQTTPIESPNYKEMELAVDISKSVAKNINENQRRTENHEVVKELYGRVNNWKGYHISKFGELLFYDKVKISSGGDISDSDREFEVFLFEKIIVLFSESGHYVGSDGLSGGSSGLGSAGNSLKKTASSSLILKKKLSNTVPTLTNGKKTKLDLRGRIMIININKVTPIGNHNLNITWESPKEQGNFVLKFRNEETRDNWNQCLQDLCKLYRAEFGTADTGSRQNSFIQSFSNININNNSNNNNNNNNNHNHNNHTSISSGAASISSATGNNSSSANIVNNNNINGSLSSRSSAYSNLKNSSASGRNQHYNSVSSLNGFQVGTGTNNSNSSTINVNNSNGLQTRLSSSGSSNRHISDVLPKNSTNSSSATLSNFEHELKLITENNNNNNDIGYKNSIPDNAIMCRISFNEDAKVTIMIPKNVPFDTLFKTIQRKVSHIGNMKKIKYQDEDGDFVNMQSEDDWEVAKEMLDDNNEYTLNVTAYT